MASVYRSIKFTIYFWNQYSYLFNIWIILVLASNTFCLPFSAMIINKQSIISIRKYVATKLLLNLTFERTIFETHNPIWQYLLIWKNCIQEESCSVYLIEYSIFFACANRRHLETSWQMRLWEFDVEKSYDICRLAQLKTFLKLFKKLFFALIVP